MMMFFPFCTEEYVQTCPATTDLLTGTFTLLLPEGGEHGAARAVGNWKRPVLEVFSNRRRLHHK
jgi:hypothetical protein